MPKVSVIMSSYNHEKFIAQAIESVLNQSFRDFEFLIIDDNSTDKTASIIKNYPDERIKFSQNSQNFGMAVNSNKMIENATGDYIAIINSDDSWHPEKLQKQIGFLENNFAFGACFTMAQMIDEKSHIITNKKSQFFKLLDYNLHQFLNHFFFNSNSLCYPSSMIRTSIIREVNDINPAYLILLDIDLWLKILLKGYNIKILPEKLTNFRLLKNNKNLSGKSPKTVIRNHLESKKILANYQKIKNYQEFIKIFPEYIGMHSGSKDLEGYYYLIDYCYKNIFSNKTNERKSNKAFSNIKNFIIELIHDESCRNPNLFQILSLEFSINYQEYSAIINQYPCGIDKLKLKTLSKKIKLIILSLTALTLSIIYFIKI